MFLPRALVARGEGTLLPQTRTLRSRGEATGQGLPWVRVELGLEQGVLGPSTGFCEKNLTLKGWQVYPGRPSGGCHSVIKCWLLGPTAGRLPREGGRAQYAPRAVLPRGGWRTSGGRGFLGLGLLSPSSDGETAWGHTACVGREGALPASTFSLLPAWPLQQGPQKVGWDEVKSAEGIWL